MLIRRDHIDIFRQHQLDLFEQRALLHLRRDLSQQTSHVSDGELLRRVRDGLNRAARYGLTTERLVMCFVDVGFLLGENFDSDPAYIWARHLLESSKLSDVDKGHLLLATACSVTQGNSQGNSERV